MKKSCVFLLVMSITSLLLAVWAVIAIINLWSLYNELINTYSITYTDRIYEVYTFRGIINFSVYFFPGIFGIIGSIKRGRFTVVCIVLGCLSALYVLLKSLLYIRWHLIYVSDLVFDVLVFVNFVLYTSAAAAAFKSRKAA